MKGQLLRAWWSDRRTRVLTILVIPLSLIDALYTQRYISEFGIQGEANPIVKLMFDVGLGSVWPLLNVAASLVLAAVVASSILILHGDLRIVLRAAFSAMMGLRTAMDTYYIIYALRLLELRILIVIVGVITYIVCENVITPWIDLKEFARDTKDLFKDLSPPKTLPALAGRLQACLGLFNSPTEDYRRREFTAVSGRLRDRKLIRSILILVLAPLALFLLLQFMQSIVSALVPSYIRSLGTVTEIQGQVFLISLAAIIVALGLVIYAVTSIFGTLTSTKPE